MQIVEMVALGEKEVQVSHLGRCFGVIDLPLLSLILKPTGDERVSWLYRELTSALQIWFQNRRQNTRRKSRPLLAQSMADIPQLHGPSTEDNDCSSSPSDHINVMGDTQSQPMGKIASDAPSVDRKDAASLSFLRKTEAFLDPNAQEVKSSSSSQNTVAQDGADPSTDSSHHEGHKDVATHKTTGVEMKTFSSGYGGPPAVHLGYISNRRSAPSAVPPCGIEQLSQSSSGSFSQPIQPRCIDSDDTQKSQVLKRTSSLVRLSMTLDGKAKVTTNDEGSPSPPRVQPLAIPAKLRQRSTLQRSTSLVASGSQSQQSGNADLLPWPRRTTSGRSRDARTWEFYCDSDARNALTAQAEQEQSGSAVGAIALIKSRHKKALAPNVNKRNLQGSRAAPVKRIKSSSHAEKPTLSRATSSMARLETAHAKLEDQSSKMKLKSLDGDSQPSKLRSPSGDSDKENWEPGTHTANIRRRQIPETQDNSQRQRPVLKENLEIISHSSSLGAVLNRENISPRRRSRKSAASGEGEKDIEVGALIGESSVPREEEDLDCVQNLLSLSQGAWR